MKYYKIEIESNNKKDNILIGCAKGNKIPNANYYFYEMREGKILLDAPLFDYFFLESFEKEKYWEKYLLDVHDFLGEGSQIMGWFVSEDLKLLLETFNLSQPYHFYPSKLLYKGKKKDYYIFQFTGKSISYTIEEQINFLRSEFWDKEQQQNFVVRSPKDFTTEYMRIFDKKIVLQKLVIKQFYDFFPMATFLHDNLVSERLKQAIEQMGITGFEFSELDYEVVVDT